MSTGPISGLWAVADGAGGHESGGVASARSGPVAGPFDPGCPPPSAVEVRSSLEAGECAAAREASQARRRL